MCPIDLALSRKNLYPTLDTLDEVVQLAQSQMPMTNFNEVYALLCTYHNTLIKTLNRE